MRIIRGFIPAADAILTIKLFPLAYNMGVTWLHSKNMRLRRYWAWTGSRRAFF